MRSIWVITGLSLALVLRALAQDGSANGSTGPTAPAGKGGVPIDISADGETDYAAGLATAHGNVVVHYGSDLLYADRISYETSTKTVHADGDVRIYSGAKVYRGEHVIFNFESKAFTSTDFSLASFPIFSKGASVGTPQGNEYLIKNGFVTTDNRSNPSYVVKAHTIEIYPGDRVVLKNVVVWVGDVPVFWLPVYYQSLKTEESTFSFQGGSSSRFGIEGLSTINWKAADDLEMSFHDDYRSQRGVAGGVDIQFRPVPSGIGTFQSYIADDKDTTYNPTVLPRGPISRTRYDFSLKEIIPFSDGLTAKVNANVWSDPFITEDFFQKEFSQERMPDNTVELIQYDPDFEFSLLIRPQVNRFFDTTEREPEFRIETKPIKIANTGIEYESESSMVNFVQEYSNQQYLYPTLPKNYSAYRWDTYHELLYPKTYFGWLTATPHIGARGTSWSNNNENLYTTGEKQSESRGVFDGGVDLSFKFSDTWLQAKNNALAIDGIRHVFSPYVNFETVLPSINRNDLVGFDTRTVNTWANPIEFPFYNSIDSIDRQIVVRQGIRNELQTKRDGQNWDLVDWSVFTDLNLTGHYDEQQVFTHDAYSHIYNDATVSPFPWMQFTSRDAVDLNGDSYSMYDNSVTWQPDRSLRLSFGDRLLEGVQAVDFFGLPYDNTNQIYVRSQYRMNEHWQFETLHSFDTDDGLLGEQSYSVYRDLSAWQLGVTVSQRSNQDASSEEMVYFTLTLKAFPAAALRVAD